MKFNIRSFCRRTKPRPKVDKECYLCPNDFEILTSVNEKTKQIGKLIKVQKVSKTFFVRHYHPFFYVVASIWNRIVFVPFYCIGSLTEIEYNPQFYIGFVLFDFFVSRLSIELGLVVTFIRQPTTDTIRENSSVNFQLFLCLSCRPSSSFFAFDRWVN